MIKAIWESWLKADMRARYWGCMCRRYYRYDQWVKIFIAITTSGTVAALNFRKDLEWLWQGLSAASAVLSVAAPFLKFTDKIKKMSNVSKAWLHVKDDYEMLWLKRKSMDEIALHKAYNDMKKKEKNIDDGDASLPSEDRKLLEQSQREVEISRGLQGGLHGK